MELDRIEKLLEKYFAAETNLQEENILKEYFSKEDVPVHLEKYKPIFNYFTNSNLDVNKKTITFPKKYYWSKWLSIAAMVIFTVSIFTIYQNDLQEKEEARIAFEQTQKALDLISFNLNKGNDAIAQLETFEKTQNKIFNK
ncbi:MAG: hypothetical protein ABFR05_03280 [Bacteroidota bacterium]